MRCERGALQVPQCAADGIAPAGFDGLAERAFVAYEDGARDEELGDVAVERRLWGTEGRWRQVDQHRPVVAHEHIAQIEPAVGDARGVEAVHLPPQVDERLVADLIRAGSFEWLDLRLPRDHQCVADGAEGGDHDLGHSDAGLGGHEGREGLVLDLLQAAGRSAAGRVAVGQEAPAPGESLRVLRVVIEHASAPRKARSRSPRGRSLGPLHAGDVDDGAGRLSRAGLATAASTGSPAERPCSPALARDLAFFLAFFLVCFGGVALGLFDTPCWLRIAGAVLLVVAYIGYVRRTLAHGVDVQAEETINRSSSMAPRATRPAWGTVIVQCVVALAIVGGADLFVEALTEVAEDAGVEAIVLALVIAPFATELPEKINSIFWARDGKDALAYGNITGAMVFQSTIPSPSDSPSRTGTSTTTRSLQACSRSSAPRLVIFELQVRRRILGRAVIGWGPLLRLRRLRRRSV
jgi:hypothetical protein